MTGFFDLAEFTRQRKLNGCFYFAEDMNGIGEVLFNICLELFERIKASYDFISLEFPSLDIVDYFKDVVEFYNSLLLLPGVEPTAFANLFKAFKNIGTYDGFTYAAKAFLGDSTQVTYTLLSHLRLDIEVSNFLNQFFDNLVSHVPDNLVTDSGDNLITHSEYFFEGNLSFVQVILEKFVPMGVVYNLSLLPTKENSSTQEVISYEQAKKIFLSRCKKLYDVGG